MSRRDITTLVVATVVILFSIILISSHYQGGSKQSGPKKTVVAKVDPNFDETTIKRLEKFFPVNFDLNKLGRPDPFAGI